MKGKLIIDGTAVYEVDEECLQKKDCKESSNDTDTDRIRSENLQNRVRPLT